MSAKYINPKLPSMIRNLHKGDPSMNSVKTMLGLAADLVQELIDLRAEQAETEWEYGHDCDESRATHHKNPSPQNPWQSMGTCTSATDYRRRKAGPWLPVPDTTNNESEDKR